MCDFKTTNLDSSPLDPRKRVRYTTGLVMGVDEFQQDQFYLMERDHLHQRSLHGYGVVSGLGIETRESSQGRWEVAVSPGLAVTPRGQSVCVDQPQCANLDDWLDRHEEELTASPPQIPGSLPLWVVLCPRDCETDPMPVLGDPCRTEEDSTVPSRILDDCELRLSLEPPEQLEEEAVQRFGDLLRSFVIAESASPFLDQAAVEDLVRGLLPGSPPGSPPASPPEPLYLPADSAAEILTAAWHVWVTEVRPALADGAEGCAGGGEPCISLGRLDLVIEDNEGSLQVASADPDLTERPFLLHTRVIQEWLTLALRPPRHGDLLGLDEDDHLQYLRVNPANRALIADLNAAGNRVVGLAAGTANGHAVRFEQAVKVGDPAGGDLSGTHRNPQVVALRGRALANAVPTVGQVLVWNGTAWTPQPQSGSGGPPPDVVETDLTRVEALSWTHNNGFAPVAFDGNPVDGIALGFNRNMDPSTFRQQTVRVWAQFPVEAFGEPPLLKHYQVPIVELLFGDTDDFDLQGRIIQVVSGGSTTVVVVFEPNAWGYIQEQTLGGQDVILRVEVLGDHLQDEDSRSPDVRFVQRTLPTGGPFDFGIQGGYFESWFSLLDQEIPVVSRQSVAAEGPTPPKTQVATAEAQEPSVPSIGTLDLNRATAKDLQSLAGVGPALARRIVDERKAGGKFASLEDLRRVSGISDNLIARLRDQQGGES